MPLLNESDRLSPAWLKLRAHLEERVAMHRRKNDNTMTPEATEKLRGRIAEANYVLGLERPAPEETEP